MVSVVLVEEGADSVEEGTVSVVLVISVDVDESAVVELPMLLQACFPFGTDRYQFAFGSPRHSPTVTNL